MDVEKQINKTEKLLEILENQEQGRELMTMQSPEEVKKFLNEKGIDCSVEEVSAIGRYLASCVASSAEGELSEEELAAVAGGGDELWPWDEPGYEDDLTRNIDKVTNTIKTYYDKAVEFLTSW